MNHEADITTEAAGAETETPQRRRPGRPRAAGGTTRRGRRPATVSDEESPAKVLAKEILALSRAASGARDGDAAALMRMVAERAERMASIAE